MHSRLDGLNEDPVFEEALELHNSYTVLYHTTRYDTISYDTIILWSLVLVPDLLRLSRKDLLRCGAGLGSLQRPGVETLVQGGG